MADEPAPLGVEAKMTDTPHAAEDRELEATFWALYRDFFDKAERKRRWSVRDDIPWDQCNSHLAPQIANIVESFCAVELYLPDYTSKILPIVRSSRGRAWFYANWGYEESKHSLALGDWLQRSGSRSDEQLADLEGMVFQREWNLPHDSRLAMLVYAMTQELATWLSYRNLRLRLDAHGGDPALSRVLTLLAVDEKAHYDFFLQCVEVYLKHDRAGTLEQMRRVMNDFRMPAIHELADSRQRIAAIVELQLIDQDLYYREVYLPILHTLNVERAEMRNRVTVPKSHVPTPKTIT
jgi:acyl-[acyl-carrier-protein] desaturase